VGKEALKTVQRTAAETRVGPDPVAVILPALAALGAIASIAALNWVVRDECVDKRRAKRQSQTILRDLSRDCADLQDIFRRLIRGLPGIATGSGTTGLPMRFGVHGLAVDSQSYPLYQSLVSSLASLTSRVSQHCFALRTALEEGLLDPPEDVFYAFGDQQERLNQILAGRPSLKSAIETGYDVAVKLGGLVEEMEGHCGV
jgi:hypothetical protein